MDHLDLLLLALKQQELVLLQKTQNHPMMKQLQLLALWQEEVKQMGLEG
jgi:hypothetical protein